MPDHSSSPNQPCHPSLDLAQPHSAPIIGYHRAPLSQKFGTPRQPNLVALSSVIEMIAPYDTPLAFVGLEAFSHIWVSWQFHHNYLAKERQANRADSNFRAQVRPPRLGGNQKVGVFASRSMYRPSGLGLSVVKLEGIEVIEGRVLLTLSGADMVDGTPIIDIKPYISYSDALANVNDGFAPAAPASLTVTINEHAQRQFEHIIAAQAFINTKDKKKQTVPASVLVHKVQKQLLASDIDYIKALIAQDPRPAYQRQVVNKAFTMRYKSVDVSFEQSELGELQITAVLEVE